MADSQVLTTGWKRELMNTCQNSLPVKLGLPMEGLRMSSRQVVQRALKAEHRHEIDRWWPIDGPFVRLGIGR